MNAIHVSVYGQVQGVGYRNWIKKSAEKIKVKGWVRNSSDGSVELFIQADLDALNQLLSLCWEGPELAEVDDVLTQESSVDMDIKEFAIR
tara:strand:+ start:78 stop:347 length:270 start_codon:yes stop_codon:yes gene_type:complete